MIFLGDNMGWWYDAPCKGVDTDFFFPSERETKKVKAAQAFCRGCLYRFPCLLWGIQNDADGIFGGATKKERHRMKVLLAIQDELHDPSHTNDQTTERVTHIVSRTGTSKVEPLPAVLDPLALLNVEGVQESHNHVPVDISPAPTEHEPGAWPTFILRIEAFCA